MNFPSLAFVTEDPCFISSLL